MRNLKLKYPELAGDFKNSSIYDLVMNGLNIYLLPKKHHSRTFIWVFLDFNQGRCMDLADNAKTIFVASTIQKLPQSTQRPR
jgi:hypothetical protein